MRALIALTLASVVPALHAAAPPPQVALPLMRHAPVIDGRINADEWREAVRIEGLVSHGTQKLDPRGAAFWLGCDGRELFIAIQSEMPPDGKLLTRAVADGKRDILDAARDDSIELWIDPHRGKTSGDRRRFQIITNARGTLYDRSYDDTNPANPVDVAWRVEWRFSSQVVGGWWHVEAAIPLASLGAEGELDHPWGLRVARNFKRPWDQAHWATARTAFADVPSMPVVTWDADAPVTRMLSVREGEAPHIALELHNPGGRALAAQVEISHAWSMDPPTSLKRTVTVAPGRTEAVDIKPPKRDLEGDYHTIIRITSTDGKRVFFFRDFSWPAQRPGAVWTIDEERARAVALRFKHYPYYQKLKVQLDVSALENPKAVRTARITLRAKGKDEVLAEHSLTFDSAAPQAVIDVPELSDGEYQIAAYLHGGPGTPKEPVVAAFQRRHFPWEHNKLGRSNVVIPPFTPLRVRGGVVSCVLRDITMNGAGVWDQVRSQGVDLLAAPMRWEIESAQGAVRVQPGKLRVTEAAEHRVLTEGAFRAGALTARVRSQWDYDGMMKTTLELPVAQQSVHRLELVIPLRAGRARWMHACGDGLRHNFAGRVPDGQGVVWDSSHGNKLDIVGTFYPYIYLGGGARGICWFADNDRDWSLDEETPAVVVSRRANIIELRVRFITRETKLDRQRRIVFGLQATPVKPMPAQPVNWRKWRANKTLPGCFRFGILGANYYWGCVSYDLYPRGGDLSVYRWIRQARETGKADSAFLESWLKGYGPWAKPDSKLMKNCEASMRYTARQAPYYPWGQSALVPYTNARGHGFQSREWPTFQDEWISSAYFNRATRGAVAYGITPTESFRDCAVWYYQKALECFDGIYWDNTYLSANRDTIAGGAWVDERGRIHPSTGLWDMRELMRRTAVMVHEQGRRGVFIPHMTNANLIPVLAFANVNLDWEWQYGERDFQDRFTPDLTVAETVGRKVGNVPLILSGGMHNRKVPRYPWVMRTRLGVCLVHELRVWDYGPKEEVDFLTKLHAFGYGEEDCRVFNYWEDGFPVTVEGIDARCIAMARGGRALVIICDYGGGGAACLRIDARALGLSADASASNFETGAALAGSLADGFTFDLKQHDFIAVLMQ